MKQFKQNGLWVILIALVPLAILTMNGCKKEDPKPVVPTPVNKAPEAKAGDDRQVEIGSVVQLDATGSIDPDGDALTYNWSFIDKPAQSQAVIIGVGKNLAEFTFDKAGDYQVLLKVSDGKLESTDSIMITNLTPIISDVILTNISGFPREFAFWGYNIVMQAQHVGDASADDLSAINVSIGGVKCEVLSKFDGYYYVVKVADSVLGGNLVLTVGNQSTTWSEPIQVAGLPMLSFINDNQDLEGRLTTSTNNVEIGTRFKPTIDGKVVGLSLVLGESGDFNVTIWDVASKSLVGGGTVHASSYKRRFVKLASPIKVNKDKEYIVSVNAARWFLYIDPNGSGTENIFMKTYNHVELIRTDYRIGTAKVFPDEGYRVHYIAKGPGIVFSPDF